MSRAQKQLFFSILLISTVLLSAGIVSAEFGFLHSTYPIVKEDASDAIWEYGEQRTGKEDMINHFKQDLLVEF